MAQPPAFNPTYDFNNEVNYSGSKLQTTHMEIKGSIDGVLTNLALIQNDDGTLKSSAVSLSSIPTAVVDGITASVNSAVNPQLTAFNSTLTQFGSSIAQLDSSIDTRINAIDLQQTAQNQLQATNSSNIVGISSRVNVLEFSQSQQDNRLTPLESQSSTNTTNIAALSSSNSQILTFLQANSTFTPTGLKSVTFDPNAFSQGDILKYNSTTQLFEPSSAGLLSELTLSLGVSEVAGSIYTTVPLALAYAKSVCQVGAKLTLNIPTGTFTGGTNLILDGSDLRIDFIGTGSNSSKISGSYKVRGDGIRFLNLEIIGVSTPTLEFQNVHSSEALPTTSGVKITDTSAGGSGETVRVFDSKVALSGMEIFSRLTPLAIQNSDVNFQGLVESTISGFAGANPEAVKVRDQSNLYINSMNLNMGSGNGSTTGIIASKGSNVVVGNQVIFNGNVSVQYSPPADTYGNFYSRIITVQ